MPLPIFPARGSELEPTQNNPIKNIIGIAAGKGGVGKSTLTVNLALALKKLGYCVGVMDTDIYGPSLRKMLPEEKLPVQKGDWIIPAQVLGMPLISMAYFRREDEASVVRAPIANSVVTQFISKVDWGVLDYLLIDFPPGTGDVQLTLSQKAGLTGVVMITTPQDVAVMDVRKAMHMFEQVRVPILGIVENMSYYVPQGAQEVQEKRVYIFGQGGGQRLAQEASLPFLGQIPLDPQLCVAGDRGQSIFNGDADFGRIAPVFLEIAGKVVQECARKKQQSADTLKDFTLDWKEMAPHE